MVIASANSQIAMILQIHDMYKRQIIDNNAFYRYLSNICVYFD